MIPHEVVILLAGIGATSIVAGLVLVVVVLRSRSGDETEIENRRRL